MDAGDADSTSGMAADGEVVWSWRSDAGAKLAKTLMRLADDGGNQAWSPGRSRISRNPLRREGRMIGSHLWFCRVLFSARGPWVRSAPGLPCALCLRRDKFDAQPGRLAPREREGVSTSLFEIRLLKFAV
jgi:hypothetical protein